MKITRMKTDLRQYKEHVIESHLGFFEVLADVFPAFRRMDGLQCKLVRMFKWDFGHSSVGCKDPEFTWWPFAGFWPKTFTF